MMAMDLNWTTNDHPPQPPQLKTPIHAVTAIDANPVRTANLGKLGRLGMRANRYRHTHGLSPG